MSYERYFAWNPTVYDGFGDTLTFYLIETRTFQKQKLCDELSSLLSRHGFTSFRIYHIFGDASILLRVWVTKSVEEHLARLIEAELPQVRNVEAHVVWDIPHHWKWGPIEFQPRSLEKLTPEFVQDVQKSLANATSHSVLNAISDGLLREVKPNPGNITFFTFVKSHENTLPRRTVSLQVDAAKSLLDKSREFLKYTAVYFLRGTQTRLLIKAETTDFFQIGSFVTELNDTLALSDCLTTTCVVASKPIVGREEIGKRSFKQIEHRDVAVAQVLPELYDDVKLQEPLKSRVVAWTKQNLVPKSWKKKDSDLEQLRAALIHVIGSNEDGFSNALNAIFRSAERPLRELQGPFIARQMGKGAVSQVVIDALRHIPNAEKKKLSHLTLGDRIHVYLFVFKSINLAVDPQLLSGWDEMVELRNEIAHNTKDLLPSWERHMSTVLDFVEKYPMLVAAVQPLAGTD